ncbi:UDP-glucose/GDP-mannose dehydrogenase family protein [Candidatus Pacearchaeota archaeon]|nr:UDP-glucose/GDP-mannose dehydrogenase family protein [Candidatus Pacearchaeota archaeon]
MKIGIIGVGWVGGTTAKVLGKIHEIYLYDKYKKPYNSQENIESLVNNSDVIFICVPTPMKPSGEIDYSSIHDSLKQVFSVSKKLKKDMDKILIAIRSTAVSGTTEKLEREYPFHFAFNPEFLTEKNALNDMMNTNKIVIGSNREEDAKKVEQVFKPIFPNAKYIHVDSKTAEMIKYAANVTLASQIAVANEIYQICKSLKIDYNKVKEAILLDDRIGKNINVPGSDRDLGFGGKCFPKDLNALIFLARENKYRPYLLEEVWRLNEKVRKNKDWLNIKGATSENNFE